MRTYIWNLLISIDQLFNTLFGGYPDETISSRMGKKLVKKESCPVCKFLCFLLNLVDKNHCIDSIENDEGEKI
jgi:hypothetical protein